MAQSSGESSEVSYWPNNRQAIVQYGTPRTGSTFQWWLLCTVARLKLGGNSGGDSRIPCLYAPNSTYAAQLIQEHRHRVVIKMHASPPDSCLNHRCLVFTSHTSAAALWPEAVYQQVPHRLLTSSLAEVSRYRAHFNLKPAEFEAVQGYLRYWSVLRQCCGKQMSLQYRLLLHGCVNDSIIASDADTLSYPACEAYDMVEIARLYTRTSIFMRRIHGDDRNARVHADDRNASDIAQSCARSRQAIIAGSDFNGQEFTNCQELVRTWSESTTSDVNNTSRGTSAHVQNRSQSTSFHVQNRSRSATSLTRAFAAAASRSRAVASRSHAVAQYIKRAQNNSKRLPHSTGPLRPRNEEDTLAAFDAKATHLIALGGAKAIQRCHGGLHHSATPCIAK